MGLRTESAVRGLTRVLAKNAGKHLGDVVWSEIEDVEKQAFKREDLRDAVKRHGLPEALVPEKLAAQGALGRARNDAQDVFPGYRFEALEKRSRDYHLFKAQGRALGGQKVTCAVIRVDGDKLVIEENPDTMDDSARDALKTLRERYAWHMEYVSHKDVSALLIRAVHEHLKGVPLKRTGHLYWVPAKTQNELRALREVFNDVKSRITVMPIYDTPESRAEVQQSAADGLDNEINKLMRIIAAFANKDGEVRDKTIENRLNEVAELRVRVDTMKEILGDKITALTTKLAQAEKSVRAIVEVKFDDTGELEEEGGLVLEHTR